MYYYGIMTYLVKYILFMALSFAEVQVELYSYPWTSQYYRSIIVPVRKRYTNTNTACNSNNKSPPAATIEVHFISSYKEKHGLLQMDKCMEKYIKNWSAYSNRRKFFRQGLKTIKWMKKSMHYRKKKSRNHLLSRSLRAIAQKDVLSNL